MAVRGSVSELPLLPLFILLLLHFFFFCLCAFFKMENLRINYSSGALLSQIVVNPSPITSSSSWWNTLWWFFLHELKGQDDVLRHWVAGGKKNITNVSDPYKLGRSWSCYPAWAELNFGSTLNSVDVRRLQLASSNTSTSAKILFPLVKHLL